MSTTVEGRYNKKKKKKRKKEERSTKGSTQPSKLNGSTPQNTWEELICVPRSGKRGEEGGVWFVVSLWDSIGGGEELPNVLYSGQAESVREGEAAGGRLMSA